MLGDAVANAAPPSLPEEGAAEAEALALAAAAVESVTKKDIAEMRSFRHPPPAVTMVTSAVMILVRARRGRGGALDG